MRRDVVRVAAVRNLKVLRDAVEHLAVVTHPVGWPPLRKIRARSTKERIPSLDVTSNQGAKSGYHSVNETDPAWPELRLGDHGLVDR